MLFLSLSLVSCGKENSVSLESKNTQSNKGNITNSQNEKLHRVLLLFGTDNEPIVAYEGTGTSLNRGSLSSNLLTHDIFFEGAHLNWNDSFRLGDKKFTDATVKGFLYRSHINDAEINYSLSIECKVNVELFIMGITNIESKNIKKEKHTFIFNSGKHDFSFTGNIVSYYDSTK